MDVTKAIYNRRAYRSLKRVSITKELVNDLAGHARLSCSCFNHQPWRFVFVYDSAVLQKLHAALSKGNEWAKSASMIIAAFSKKEDDCMIRDREYHQFDLGISAGFLVLRATELGLVAHPIAGFSPKKTREILGIPGEYRVITLIIVGGHNKDINPVLSEDQKKAERRRPRRRNLGAFVHHNFYGGREKF